MKKQNAFTHAPDRLRRTVRGFTLIDLVLLILIIAITAIVIIDNLEDTTASETKKDEGVPIPGTVVSSEVTLSGGTKVST
jgi:competence protein ComGC